MKRFGLAAVLLTALVAAPAVAQERGTPDDAVTLVKRTTEMLKTKPAAEVYAAINAKGAEFIIKDVYVFVQDAKGMVLAHTVNPKLVGKDASENTDVNGKEYVKERMELAKTKKEIWHEYSFSNPISKKIEPRSVYCEVQPDTTIVCASASKQ